MEAGIAPFHLQLEWCSNYLLKASYADAVVECGFTEYVGGGLRLLTVALSLRASFNAVCSLMNAK